MAAGGGGRSAQPPRAAQQRVVQQRAQQVRRTLQDQQRAARQRRAVAQRAAVPRQRTARERTTDPQRDLQLELEVLRQQEQRWRVWQRTAGKRAARQVETEQAILEREERLRVHESYAAYVRRRHAAARAATTAAAARSQALETLVATVVSTPLALSFARLKRPAEPTPFDAAGLDVPLREPVAADFAPHSMHLPSWLPGQRDAREHARVAAETAYRQAMEDFREAEFDRVRRLSTAKLEHRRREVAAAERTRADHAAVDRLEAGYRAHDPAAVEEFARLVLSSRVWPEGVQLSCRLHYRPESRQLDSECVLPDPDVVPAVRRYRYVPAVDDIRRQFLPEAELRARYADCVAQIAVSALFDLFTCLDPDVVDVVRLDARVRVAPYFDVTGPHVLSVVAIRQAWAALRPGEQDPQAVLAGLGARVSPDPYAGVPVPPHAGFEP